MRRAGAKVKAGLKAAGSTGVLLLGVLAIALMVRDIDQPGLYYDEVIQAVPAQQFLRNQGVPAQIPGARGTLLFDRWLPLMTQPYMGALKSQLLIPVFLLLPDSAATLRATTLFWGIAGVLLAFLWARRILGLPVALLCTAFLLLDPSLLFVARHDWGSFALGMVCRCGALLLLTTGWQNRSLPGLVGGGLLLGLGLYNKIDFAVFPVAAGAALLVSAPGVAGAALRDWRTRLLGPAAGFLLGAAPVLPGLIGTLTVAGHFLRRQQTGSADWAEKLSTLVTTLDGSYFHHLMLAGGSFERMFDAPGAARGPFLLVFAASAVFLAARLMTSGLRGDGERARAFVLATALFSVAAILATPRAVRVHHALNLYPFPHLVVACAVTQLWQLARSRARVPIRALAAGVVGAVLTGSLVVDLRTLAFVRETGGTGRWSGAVERFGGELALREERPVVVSLDWGFDGPLRFIDAPVELVEAVWQLSAMRSARIPWSLEGDERHIYLFFADERYRVFDFGTGFLAAVRRLPPGSVEIREHRDRGGEPVFTSVALARPHRVVYRDRFEVQWR